MNALDLKDNLLSNLDNFLAKLEKISSVKKGDVVFMPVPRPGDIDYHPAIVLDTNAYHGYITVIDISEDNQLKEYEYFITLERFADNSDKSNVDVIEEIKSQYATQINQVLRGEFDYLLKD